MFFAWANVVLFLAALLGVLILAIWKSLERRREARKDDA